MLFGIGTDLVKVSRIQTLLDKHQDKIAQRILSDSEFIGFKKSAKPASFLAKRFAAKEAVAKAFGTGFRNGLSLRHISIENDANGKPELKFSGQAQTFIEENKIQQSLLSLSDDGDYAIAYVTLVEG
jgi:holo-[acyl-carrier protein] synthase